MPRYVVDYRKKGCVTVGHGRAVSRRRYRTILADMARRVALCGVVRMTRATRGALVGPIVAEVARQSGPANETGSAWCGARCVLAGKRVVRRAWLA